MEVEEPICILSVHWLARNLLSISISHARYWSVEIDTQKFFKKKLSLAAASEIICLMVSASYYSWIMIVNKLLKQSPGFNWPIASANDRW